MIKHPDHVTIAVTDLEKAIKFFALLNFEKKIEVTISGKVFEHYMGIKKLKATHVTLVLANASPHFEIQLLKFESPTPQKDPNIHRLDKIGYNHLCLAVDDIQATVDKLKKSNVKIINEIMQFHNRKLVYFQGPDGLILELAEWLKAPNTIFS